MSVFTTSLPLGQLAQRIMIRLKTKARCLWQCQPSGLGRRQVLVDPPAELVRQIVMFDRTASARLAHQRDQAEICEPADVICGHAQRSVELVGELPGTGLPLTQHLEDAGAQRMGERLAKALILDVVVSAQAFVPLSGTPYVRAQGRTATLAVSRKVDH